MKANKRGSRGSGCVVLLSVLFSLPPFPPLVRQRHGIIQCKFPNKSGATSVQIADNSVYLFTALRFCPCVVLEGFSPDDCKSSEILFSGDVFWFVTCR